MGACFAESNRKTEDNQSKEAQQKKQDGQAIFKHLQSQGQRKK